MAAAIMETVGLHLPKYCTPWNNGAWDVLHSEALLSSGTGRKGPLSSWFPLIFCQLCVSVLACIDSGGVFRALLIHWIQKEMRCVAVSLLELSFAVTSSV